MAKGSGEWSKVREKSGKRILKILKRILSGNPVIRLHKDQWQFSCHQLSCQLTRIFTGQHMEVMSSVGSRGSSGGSSEPPPPSPFLKIL